MAFVVPIIAAATAAAPSVGTIATAASAVGGVVGAVGAYQQSQAASNAAKYNAQVSTQNATLAQRNASISAQSGEAQVGMQQQKTRATLGAIKANQAASGLDVNSGSAVDVRSSASELGELDALTVRSNAMREAFGYRTQSTNYKAQSTLDQYQAENADTAGIIGAGSTFLGGVSSAASNYAKYQMAGGFGG